MNLLTLGGFAFIIMIAIFFGFVMGFVSKHNDSDSNAKRTIYAIREAVFPNREEALMVLDNMMNEIDKYGQVSVADYYDWIGIGDSTFADVSYGWDDLNRARVVSVRGGYAISLPPVGVIES